MKQGVITTEMVKAANAPRHYTREQLIAGLKGGWEIPPGDYNHGRLMGVAAWCEKYREADLALAAQHEDWFGPIRHGIEQGRND